MRAVAPITVRWRDRSHGEVRAPTMHEEVPR